MKSLFRPMREQLLMLVFAIVPSICGAQTTSEPSELGASVEKRSYTFVAQTASPQRGGMVRITGTTYTIKVNGDTLVCDLPYYGRVYNATYGGDAGLKFTSGKFDHKITPRKKGGWNVRIKTSDIMPNREMWLTIFENGSTTVNIASSDRQSINYSGTVMTQKK